MTVAARDIGFFAAGLALGVLLVVVLLFAKRLDLFGSRPDRILTYREIDGDRLTLHVFDARGTGPALRPAVLWFHGGRWQYGGPRAAYPRCAYFAEHGLACVSVEYRVRSRHGTDPRAALQDASAALRYLRDQADALGIDPQRIVVGGGSSGGHLAAAIGVGVPLLEEPADRPDRARPAALLLYNPMLDLSPCMPDHHLVAEYWQQISPLHHVGGDVPPSLILVGTEDREVPVATVEAFKAAVEAHGGRCELALYEGMEHGFFNPRVAGGRYFAATNQRALDFLRQTGLLDD